MITINCPNCNTTNRDRARFCAACGATLPRLCSQCGSALSQTAQFCPKCGTSVQTQPVLVRGFDDVLLPGTLLEGRYRLQHLLGMGGFARVYLAHDLAQQNTSCAVKELTDNSPENQRQFERECGFLLRLSHPRLVRLRDYFQTDAGEMFLVMDYIPGEDLEQVLEKTTGFLPEDQIVRWALQICDVLEYMHGQTDPKTGQRSPVIHRDIKPGNLKLLPDGSIIVIDLGIAKVKEIGRKTTMAARAISPPYSPLEQYGQGTDERSDIYSLGVTLYELATGGLPPEAPERHRDPVIPPRQINPALSPGLEQIILCALHPHPENRFQTIADMRAALCNRDAFVARTSESIHRLLTDALKQRKWVRMTYTNEQGKTTEKSVLPNAVTPSYLIGQSTVGNTQLHFRCDRISQAALELARPVPPLSVQPGVLIRPITDWAARQNEPKWVTDPTPYTATGNWEIVPLTPVPVPLSPPSVTPAAPAKSPVPSKKGTSRTPSAKTPPTPPATPAAPVKRPATAQKPVSHRPGSKGKPAGPPTPAAKGIALPASPAPNLNPWIKVLQGALLSLIPLILCGLLIYSDLNARSIPIQPAVTRVAVTKIITVFATPQRTPAPLGLPNLTVLPSSSVPEPVPTQAMTAEPAPSSPGADLVLVFNPGPGAQPEYSDPDAALGEPDLIESPCCQGMVQLGRGGSILLAFTDKTIVNGKGPDFQVNGESARDDYLLIEVSADGQSWHAYPKVSESPGALDLEDIGLEQIVFIRLTDVQPGTPSGAELDAVVAINSQPAQETELPVLPDAVLRNDVVLREGPDARLNENGTLKAGKAVHVLGRNDSTTWVKVQAENGQSGWCAISDLGLNTSVGKLTILEAPPTPTPRPQTTSTPTHVPATATFVPAAPAPREYQSKYFSVSVTGPTTRMKAILGPNHQAEAEGIFLIVPLRWRNTSLIPRYIEVYGPPMCVVAARFPNCQRYDIDGEWAYYDLKRQSMPPSDKIAPGKTLDGWMVFDIPETMTSPLLRVSFDNIRYEFVSDVPLE